MKVSIRENAESRSQTLINVVYFVNLSVCIIGIIAGLIILFDEFELGLIMIISSIILTLFIILIKALFDTFVNISIKLDAEKSILIEIEKIRVLLNNMNNDLSKTNNTNIPQPATTPNSSTKKIIQPVVKPKTDNTKTSDPDLDNTILGEIMSGNDVQARYILMQKKGLSLNAAIEYINNIKTTI